MKKLLLLTAFAISLFSCKKEENNPTHSYTVEASINLIDSSVNRWFEIGVNRQYTQKMPLPTLKRPTNTPPATWDSTFFMTYSYVGDFPAYCYVKTDRLLYSEAIRLKFFQDGELINEDSVRTVQPIGNPIVEFFIDNYGR